MMSMVLSPEPSLGDVESKSTIPIVPSESPPVLRIVSDVSYYMLL